MPCPPANLSYIEPQEREAIVRWFQGAGMGAGVEGSVAKDAIKQRIRIERLAQRCGQHLKVEQVKFAKNRAVHHLPAIQKECPEDRPETLRGSVSAVRLPQGASPAARGYPQA